MNSMGKNLVCILLSAAMLLSAAGCGNSKPKPKDTIEQYTEAFNNGDKDALIGCYDPDLQEAYHSVEDTGSAIAESMGAGSFFNAFFQLATQQTAAERPQLSMKIKDKEQLADDRVRLTVLCTYTINGRDTTEEITLEMVLRDGKWYITVPEGSPVSPEDIASAVTGVSDVMSGIGSAFSDVSDAVGSMMSGMTQQTTAVAETKPAEMPVKGENYDFSFAHPSEGTTDFEHLVYELSLGKYEASCTGYITMAELEKQVKLLPAEHPELFFTIAAADYGSGPNTGSHIKYREFDGIEEAELSGMMKDMQNKGAAILSQMPTGLSDYEKALYVHDYLISHCEYDTDSTLFSYSYANTAYGCLMQGKAVCDGYSRAYQYLMRALGIECGVVYGEAGSEHMWNYVKLDGDYYWLDVTWDDPVHQPPEAEQRRHCYFLLDDAHFLQGREVLGENHFVPMCRTMKLNYFVQSGLYFAAYDREKVLEAIAAQPVGTVTEMTEIMFGSAEAYQAAKADLITEADALRQLDAYAEGEYLYSEEEDLYVLSFAPKQ